MAAAALSSAHGPGPMLRTALLSLLLLLALCGTCADAARLNTARSIDSMRKQRLQEPAQRMAHLQEEAQEASAASLDPATSACVQLSSDGLLQLAEGPEGAIACGTYVPSLKTRSNFGKLRVVSFEGFPDELQMQAAGWIEGYLSAPAISDQCANIHSYFTGVIYTDYDLTEAVQWLKEQEAWVKQQVLEKRDAEPQWRAVGLVQTQFDGLVEGYQAAAAECANTAGCASVDQLDRSALVFLNNNGELYDIIDHLQGQKPLQAEQEVQEQAEGASRRGGRGQRSRPWPHVQLGDLAKFELGPEAMLSLVALQGHCSGLIKVVGDLSDVLIGHSTWDTYTSALRIFKFYDLSLSDPEIKSHSLAFSSYPGEVFSDDDLYVADTGLVVIETTNHIFDPRLLENLSKFTLPSWIRVRSAFLLAESGQEWVRQFSSYNSGTYNNQYMVVDLNKFLPRQKLEAGFLWVVEQIPDLVVSLDATQMLAYDYWPSFNVPYFEEVYNATGYPLLIKEMEDKDPTKFQGAIRWLKYQICPRAAIFRRDQGSVQSLEGMKRIMRYNNYRRDPYSSGNANYAVCGRGDLVEGDTALPKGGYDSKVTSYYLALNLQAEVVNGPTPTSENTPFSWSSDPRWSAPQYVHRGHPDVFDFEFERMSRLALPVPGDEAFEFRGRTARA